MSGRDASILCHATSAPCTRNVQRVTRCDPLSLSRLVAVVRQCAARCSGLTCSRLSTRCVSDPMLEAPLLTACTLAYLYVQQPYTTYEARRLTRMRAIRQCHPRAVYVDAQIFCCLSLFQSAITIMLESHDGDHIVYTFIAVAFNYLYRRWRSTWCGHTCVSMCSHKKKRKPTSLSNHQGILFNSVRPCTHPHPYPLGPCCLPVRVRAWPFCGCVASAAAPTSPSS
jgi:hypothetical protein